MESPCVQVCVVEDGICTACDRTVEEIASWSVMSESERAEIIKKNE